jgi:hypothetical protein
VAAQVFSSLQQACENLPQACSVSPGRAT